MGAPLLFQVIGTALGLGIVHVMTGPDHLSALSTLSVGKPLKTAFGLGVRWGCGHSFGLLIVAIIFFALGRSVDLDAVTYFADLFVGIFMILLGAWYMIKAFRERMQYLRDRERKEALELLHRHNSQSTELDDVHYSNKEEANYNMEPIVLDDGKHDDNDNEHDVNQHDDVQIEMEEIQQIDGVDVCNEIEPVSNDNDTSGSNESEDALGKDPENSKSSEIYIAILRL